MKFKKVGKKLFFFKKNAPPGPDNRFIRVKPVIRLPGSGAGCLKQKTRGPGAGSRFLPNTRKPAPDLHPYLYSNHLPTSIGLF
jgi:hypothetical protein